MFVFRILNIYVSVKIQWNIKYVNLHVLYEYLNKVQYLSMVCATDIAPTAEGSVRPNLPYYSDTTERAFMCQATICQILVNSTPFYSASALQKNPTNPTAVIPCLLTSHHTIHSICFCSHPWCKWPHWAIPAFSSSAAGGRHLQKGHELCLCLWFHSASSTALFHLHTEGIKHLQEKYNSKLHILKCTEMIWASKSMGNTDQAHNEQRKINSHSLLIKHVQHFLFQHAIEIEHRPVIWLCLDKYAYSGTALC